MYTVLSLEPFDEDIHVAVLGHDEQQLQAMLIGEAAVGDAVAGDWSLEQIMALRPATEEQVDGFSEGPGFQVFCGTVARVYDWGSYDLHGGGITLMLDADELPKYEITLGMRLSIGFKHAVLTLC